MFFFKKLKAVRGAVCCKNESEDIKKNIECLYTEILTKNKISEKNIVSVQFTVTDDLTELNPATALRKSGFAKTIPLFCSAEPKIKTGLSKTIRILIYYYGRKNPIPVYLNGAEILRPDIYFVL